MPFVSYAQNFEDLMLWRALGSIKDGFYIDIGALSPNYDTVTKAFYERGWHGINIEPNPQYLNELKELRPRDQNLGFAVSNESGPVKFHIFENPGLSTMNRDVAEVHKVSGIQSRVVEAQARTITQIWKDHVAPEQDVHFLKIDVEGHEGAVIRGGDWKSIRPWIIVVEATYPNSQTATHAEWEFLLGEAGYAMIYWDGLNRFYLAQEHSELGAKFSSPPNVFDDFELARYAVPMERLREEFKEAIRGRDDAMRAFKSAEAASEEAMRVSQELLEALKAEKENVDRLQRKLTTETAARQQAEKFLLKSKRRWFS